MAHASWWDQAMSIVEFAGPPADFLAPGTRIGRYELLQRLAIGGMTELYLARATGIEGFSKLVALKRILPRYAARDDCVARFLDEARLAATLRHANVAQVYDIGQCDRGLFFTMEFVHGEDLRALLRATGRRGQRVPLEHGLAIARGAAAGLHAAHVATGLDGEPLGIVHRDVSPSNLLVSFDGCVKVIDFGVATATRRRSATRSGTPEGTVSYRSPEQCRGGAIDHRSDVFALGVMLYELTTGTRLFRADNEVAIMQQIVWRDAEPPSARVDGYPPALERIVLRALARDRDLRHPTAQALQLDLERLARDLGLSLSSAALGAYMRGLFAGHLELFHELHRASSGGRVVELPLPAPDKSAPVPAPRPIPASDTEPHRMNLPAPVDHQIHLIAEATRGDTGEPVHTGLFELPTSGSHAERDGGPELERDGRGRLVAVLSILALASALLAWTLRPRAEPTVDLPVGGAEPAALIEVTPSPAAHPQVTPTVDAAVVRRPAAAAGTRAPEQAERAAKPREPRPARSSPRRAEPPPTAAPPADPEPPADWDLDSPLPPS
jgi:serine/threonine protein kinase